MPRALLRTAVSAVVLLSAIVVCGAGRAHRSTQRAAADTKPATARGAVDAALSAFYAIQYPRAEELARSVLGARDASKADLVDAYKCLACVYVMQREQQRSLESLIEMLRLDPTARFSPDALYPPRIIAEYNTLRDSLFPGTMDINTIAIGDFEDNSVYTGKFKNYDFKALTRALPHLITYDLAQASDLKVVDRQRTNEILKELAVTTSGFADPQQAVHAGKLLGAHAYVFGQYMLLSRKSVRIDMRVVRTATGEVVEARQITGDFSGQPEAFFGLEKKLVTEVLRSVNEALGQESGAPAERAGTYFGGQAGRVRKRTGYVEGVFLTSAALEAEEKRDYAAALDTWRRVLKVDPGSKVAAVRVKLLEQSL